MNPRVVDKELEDLMKKMDELGRQWFELTNLADKEIEKLGSVPLFLVERLEAIAKQADEIHEQVRNRPKPDKVLKRLMHLVSKSNSSRLAKYRQHIG